MLDPSGIPSSADLENGAHGVTRRRLAVTLWRRKWIVIGTVVTLTALTAIVSKSLPKQYEATATLWVTQGRETATFDAVQAGQVLAGTYGKVADSQILAERVATALPFESTGGDVLNAMSFQPVAETQLLRITATSEEPVRARVLANTYARIFIDYSRTQLGDAIGARIAFAAPASLPTQPARPQPTLYTLAGALLALGIGIGLALLAEAVDRRVRSTEELETLVAAPVLARIPRRGDQPETEMVFDETFRLLRTNLQFLRHENEQLRSIVVVSPSAGDGKSTVAYHLARSYAEADIQVILIEADMRRPSLRGYVLTSREDDQKNGLSAYLSRKAGLAAVLSQTDLPSLQFIPSGILPPTPSTLVSVERSQVLLDDALDHADLVIVDTPPLSVGAEASTLAASADGALMVVNTRVSGKHDIRRARQQLAVVNSTLVGVAVNSVRELPNFGAYSYRYRVSEGTDIDSGRKGLRRRPASVTRD